MNHYRFPMCHLSPLTPVRFDALLIASSCRSKRHYPAAEAKCYSGKSYRWGGRRVFIKPSLHGSSFFKPRWYSRIYSKCHTCVPTCPPIFVEDWSTFGAIESLPPIIRLKLPDDLVSVGKLCGRIETIGLPEMQRIYQSEKFMGVSKTRAQKMRWSLPIYGYILGSCSAEWHLRKHCPENRPKSWK